MNWKRITAVLVVVGVVAAGGYFIYQRQIGAETAGATPTPENGESSAGQAEESADDFVSAEGTLIPLRTVDLSFQGGGQVAELLVQAGDTVAAGDVLLRLDAGSLELARDQAAAAVAVAEAGVAAAQMRLTAAEAAVETAQTGVSEAAAQLALLQAGPRQEAVAAAQFDVTAAQSGVAQAAANRQAVLEIPQSQILAAQANVAASQATLNGIQEQYDAIIEGCAPITLPDGSTQDYCPLYGPVEESTRAQLQQAQLQADAAQAALDALQAGPTSGQNAAASGGVAVAQANLALAEAQLALALAGATPEQIEQAEIGVELAGTAVTQAEVGVTQAQAGVVQAEAALTQAQANLQSTELALERMSLRAPFAGTVATVNPELGELVAPGMPVITLADFSTWLVETTDLTELDVVNIAPGDPVEIQVDAVPDVTLRGTIQHIDRVATPARGDVTYAVTIELEESSDLPLRWGMTVFVDVAQ